MYIELRTPDERLRGPKAVDAAPVLASVLHAARDGSADLSRLRVVCDWIQYKHNFREMVTASRSSQPRGAHPSALPSGSASCM